MIHEHHRKRRSQGGGDDPVNVLGLPDVIHEWVHANPKKAYECGLLVKSTDDPATVKVTIPEEALKKVRAPRSTTEPARKRKTYSFKVPNDAEDGADVLDVLIQECREAVVSVLGYEEDVPAYFVLVAVLHDWLTDNSSSTLEGVPKREASE